MSLSKDDSVLGYYQVPIAYSDKPVTSVNATLALNMLSCSVNSLPAFQADDGIAAAAVGSEFNCAASFYNLSCKQAQQCGATHYHVCVRLLVSLMQRIIFAIHVNIIHHESNAALDRLLLGWLKLQRLSGAVSLNLYHSYANTLT